VCDLVKRKRCFNIKKDIKILVLVRLDEMVTVFLKWTWDNIISEEKIPKSRRTLLFIGHHSDGRP